MSSIAALAGRDTIVAQMVAFSDPSWQLERYLETMEEAGLVKCFLPALRAQEMAVSGVACPGGVGTATNAGGDARKPRSSLDPPQVRELTGGLPGVKVAT